MLRCTNTNTNTAYSAFKQPAELFGRPSIRTATELSVERSGVAVAMEASHRSNIDKHAYTLRRDHTCKMTNVMWLTHNHAEDVTAYCELASMDVFLVVM